MPLEISTARDLFQWDLPWCPRSLVRLSCAYCHFNPLLGVSVGHSTLSRPLAPFLSSLVPAWSASPPPSFVFLHLHRSASPLPHSHNRQFCFYYPHATLSSPPPSGPLTIALPWRIDPCSVPIPRCGVPTPSALGTSGPSDLFQWDLPWCPWSLVCLSYAYCHFKPFLGVSTRHSTLSLPLAPLLSSLVPTWSASPPPSSVFPHLRSSASPLPHSHNKLLCFYSPHATPSSPAPSGPLTIALP